MRQLVSDTLERFHALCPSDARPIGLAVSGGSDSMALLHLALEWRPAEDLIVFTVNHGLRPEARREAQGVADHCAQLGVAHQTLIWTPPDGHVSQARARDARHRLLACALRACGARYLLFGHTLDDQYETIAMRAERGTAGLAGMRAVSVSPVWPEGRDLMLARPLLETRRAALRAFLASQAVSWVEDPSNENRDFERVRVRQKLSKVGKQDLQALYQTALADRQERDNALVLWLRDHVDAGEDGGIVCDTGPLNQTEFAEGLSYLLLAASGSDKPATLSGRLKLAGDILTDPKGWRSRTLGGSWLALRKGRVQIARDPGQVPPAPDLSQLTGASQSLLWDGRFEIWAKSTDLSQTAHRADSVRVSALSRAGFPALDSEHALLRCLVGDRLGHIKNVLGHENCVFAC